MEKIPWSALGLAAAARRLLSCYGAGLVFQSWLSRPQL